MKSLYIAFFLGALVVHSCMFELAICYSNYTDQLSLLAFKSSIDHDPNNVSTNWTKEINFCNWAGVLCSRRRQRVTCLHLGNMGLRGTVSPHIGNLSFLQVLDIHNNSFNGHLTNEFEHLRRLIILIVQFNMLEGSIPVGLHQCQNLQWRHTKRVEYTTLLRTLFLGRNNLQRTIPPFFGNTTSLEWFGVEFNNIYGNIPIELSLLPNLNGLYCQANHLTGSIPQAIFNKSSMIEINLNLNALSGNLPTTTGLWLPNLEMLGLQENKLSGSIPSCITKLCSLQVMDISSNKLTLIPSSLWNLENLRLSNLSFNSLNGSLDPHKALKVLESMDLSWNQISGNIPRIIGSFQSLTSLNLSRNSFSGPMPNSIRNLVALDFLGLSLNKLSGPIPKHRRKNVHSQYSNDLFATIEHKKVSYQELQRATTDFCEANLLGEGSYGSVYKGVLSDGTIVAIKILNLQVEGAFRSFNTECEVLRTKRHRNLVRVITTCSNPELRALVLQYMSNGSLDKWLYSHNYCLNFFQRESIIIDVALALEYLHEFQSEPVVHSNLKPSNVLLDEDMIAHVADFGIAKNLAESKTAAQTNTLYGSEGRVSTSSDIYSYGIMLLETFKRKKPTDEMFAEEMSLRQWVSTSLPDEVMEVVDSGLLKTQNAGHMVATQSNLIAILELGLECCRELVADRIQIKEIGIGFPPIRDRIEGCYWARGGPPRVPFRKSGPFNV
ncbi:hypothetical protein ACSBR1_026005 [Camellia fascicularis]